MDVDAELDAFHVIEYSPLYVAVGVPTTQISPREAVPTPGLYLFSTLRPAGRSPVRTHPLIELSLFAFLAATLISSS